jgi:hypothetical protein
MTILPGWLEAVGLVYDIGRIYNGSIFDFTVNRSWDPGQAVCREAYGSDWMNSKQFQEANNSPIAPIEFIEAARKIIQKCPSWSKDFEA